MIKSSSGAKPTQSINITPRWGSDKCGFVMFYKYSASPKLKNNISKREKLIKMIGFFYAFFLAQNYIPFIDSTLDTTSFFRNIFWHRGEKNIKKSFS